MLDLVVGLPVVFVDVRLADAVPRKHLHEPHDAALDQVDAGRFQRLDEAARKADGNAVAVPGLAALARPELDDARLGEHLAFDVGQQALFGRVVGEVAAAVHHAVADAMLQRDAPLPAGIARDRARVGNGRPHGLGLQRHGAVAEQLVRPVFIAHVQRVADEQAAKAGAIDEQVAFEQRRRNRA